MSLDATRWAWQQTIRPSHKLVLLSLADRAGTDSTVWPSYEQLTHDTGLDRKTISQAIQQMITLGLIEDTKERKGKTKQVPVYKLIGVELREKQSQKRNALETVPKTELLNRTENAPVVNETVPFFPLNSTENGMSNRTENGIRNLPIEPTKNLKEQTDHLFEMFWKAYPKKKGKLAAASVWKKIPRKAETVKLILAALEWQKKSQDWVKDGGQYVPNPATYLNQGRWMDEPPRTNGGQRCLVL